MTEPSSVAERIRVNQLALRNRATVFHMRSLDWFVVVNLTMFVTIRWVQNTEFAFYMVVMAALLVALWAWLRRFDYSIGLLAAVEAGLLAHFAGGLVVYGPEDVRLYGHFFLGIRFDKIVHAYSCSVLAFFVWDSLVQAGVQVRPGLVWMLPIFVLGAGAFWEIIEYTAVANLTLTGVGDYVNNAEDLVANLLGGIFGTVLVVIRQQRARGRAIQRISA